LRNLVRTHINKQTDSGENITYFEGNKQVTNYTLMTISHLRTLFV